MLLVFQTLSNRRTCIIPISVCAEKFLATLGYPNKDWAVAKLTPEQQNLFVQSDSKTFRPVKGAWGRRGNAKIYLPRAKIDIVRDALTLAWRNVAPKHLQQNF